MYFFHILSLLGYFMVSYHDIMLRVSLECTTEICTLGFFNLFLCLQAETMNEYIVQSANALEQHN